jgi:ribonuclease Z
VDLSVFFAGTAGSVPTARRGLPAVLLQRGGDRLLVDCGEGTQRQLLRSVGLPDLDAVLLTHFHLDHWFGLPPMLKSFALRDRDKPLEIYGPPGTRDLLAAVDFVIGRLPYRLTVDELEPGEVVEFDGYGIEAFNVRHRGTSFGYALVEHERPGRFDVELARRLGVPEGPAFGALQRGEPVDGVTPDQVVGPARAGRKVVVSGDTAPCDTLRAVAHGADVLVHEATFVDADRDRARETRHSTARQAAELAAEADVRLLALTHLSGRYTGREVLAEARATFERTELPRDFDAVEVPFREKGEPELLRWSDRPQAPLTPLPAPAAP